jgi:hypothetical protein
MDKIFEMLLERIMDANSNTDNSINSKLKQIKNNVICVGVGGSYNVSEYARIVFNIKNKCISVNMSPRDLLYEDISNFENIFMCSHSGNNYGVKIISNIDKNVYLLTSKNKRLKNINILQYKNKIEKIDSFISIDNTLIPMSMLLKYYLNKDIKYLIIDMFNNIDSFSISYNDNFEVMSGLDTKVASTCLESSFVESGLANITIHDKYSFCHGRSTLPYSRKSTLIYLTRGNKELDNLILKRAKELYTEIVILESNYNDIVIDNFNLTLKALYLMKYLAKLKGIDLSKIKHIYNISELYYFEGEM